MPHEPYGDGRRSDAPSSAGSTRGAPSPVLHAAALELIGDACIAVDRQLCVTYANRHAAALFGRPRDHVLESSLPDSFPEEHRELVARLCARVMREQRSSDSTEYFSGWNRWVECRLHPMPDGLLLFLRDVTEQTRAVNRLQVSEERFRALVEHASDMISILDDDARYSYVSPSHERVLGWSDEALMAGTLLDFVHPDDAAMAQLAYSEVRRTPGETIHPLPLRFRHASGGWCTLDMLLTNLTHDPAVGGVVVNSRDFTEQQALATQLRQAQRMEALGQLAGGVAHDFNNVLAAVTGFTQLALDQLPTDSLARADMEEVLRTAERGAGVARQLLTFGRTARTDVAASVDLSRVVREVIHLLRPLLPSSIAVVLRLPDEPLWVRGIRPQLDQVIMNLAVNARDAMPDGGTLSISLDRCEDDRQRSMTRLRVRDSGSGMSTEVLAHLFEPFFTTKPTGRGTGLGLAVVYGIVRHSGGRITAHSIPEEGSTFTILLPDAPPAEEPDTHCPTRATTPPVDGATVLVAEDEEGVRLSAGRLLEQAGFHVLLAADGDDAMRILDGYAGTVDLLLTDVTMPGLGGRGLATRAAERRPRMPVVLMSGYEDQPGDDATARVHPDQEGDARVVAYLDKPFTADRLLEVVRRAIDG